MRQSYYSVPAHLAGRRVEARLGADSVIIRAEGKVVASHTRSLHKGSEDLIRKSSRGRASGTTGLAWLRRGAGAGEAVVRRRARG